MAVGNSFWLEPAAFSLPAHANQPCHATLNHSSLSPATDLASVITLANELRAALVEKLLIKGGE